MCQFDINEIIRDFKGVHSVRFDRDSGIAEVSAEGLDTDMVVWQLNNEGYRAELIS